MAEFKSMCDSYIKENSSATTRRLSEDEKKIIFKVLTYWYLLAFLGQEHQQEETLKENLKPRENVSTKKVFLNYPYLSSTVETLAPVPAFALNMAKELGWKDCSSVFTLHIGMMRRFVALERLVELLDLENTDRPENDPGYEKSAEPLTLATLQLDSTGKYVDGSFSLSKTLWLLSVLKEDKSRIFQTDFNPERSYKESFSKVDEEIRERISLNDSLGRITGEEFEGVDVRAIHCGRLQLIMQYIVDKFVNNILCDKPVNTSPLDPSLEKKESDINLLCYIDCSFHMKESDESDQEDSFSSLSMDFFTEDLKLVRDRIFEHSPYPMGQGLVDYLLSPVKEFSEEDRINVLPDRMGELSALLNSVLDPRLYPEGKWPSKYSPALMQEVAINLICSRTKVLPDDLPVDCDKRLKQCVENDSGFHLPENDGQCAIFSVNGPPGTGKTTMLKEIVVNNIVERAKLLACYEEPDDAFIAHRFAAKRSTGVHTTESAYYPYNKTDTTGHGYYDKFCQNWYSFKNDRINDFGIVVASCNNAAVDNISKEFPNLKNLFGGLDFDAANPDCEENGRDPALQDVARLFCRTTTSGSIFVKRKRNDQSIKEEERDVFFNNLANSLFSTVNTKKNKDNDANSGPSEDAIEEDLSPSKLPSHSCNEIAWGLCAAPYGKKKNIKKYLNEVVYAFLYNYDSDKEHYKKARENFLEQLVKVDSIRHVLLKIAEKDASGIAANNTGTAESFECTRIDDVFLNQATDKYNPSSQAKVHAKNPYTPTIYNREREKLFFYALQLTKHFALASKALKRNMCMYNYAFKKKNAKDENVRLSHDDQATALPSLFQSIFLLTPVLSSTFASIGRCFREITEPGTIGMLIVDEAGQAQPFCALGALFRSRRAVIVGDPKQIDPVVTDELNYLRKSYGYPELYQYKNPALSVQSFADNINKFGTYLVDPDVPDFASDCRQWVGCPLVVHRRCIDPMFSIANSISYGGMMKQQTMLPKESEAKLLYGNESFWLDIKNGKEKGGGNHYVEEQGNAAVAILRKLIGIDPEIGSKRNRVYLISPFKSVVAGLKLRIKQDSFLTSKKLDKKWCNENIGTVHTFQGKEALTVIFVIGCSSQSTGAISWISSNIINVAVTRAKYRLYVVGDIDICSASNRYLKVMAHKLSYRRPDVEFLNGPELLKVSGDICADEGDGSPEICPVCGKRSLQRKFSKLNQSFFWGCSNHHENDKKVVMDDDDGKPAISTCPKCGGVLIRQRKKDATGFVCLTNDCMVNLPEPSGTLTTTQSVLKNQVRHSDSSPSTEVAECPVCHKRTLKRSFSKKNSSYFWSCREHTDNEKVTMDDDNGKPAISSCPVCGGVLIRQKLSNFTRYVCLSNNCHVNSSALAVNNHTITKSERKKQAPHSDSSPSSEIAECPVCHKRTLKRSFSKKNNRYFWCCREHTGGENVFMDDDHGSPAIFICPKCNGVLVRKRGQGGQIWFSCISSGCKVTQDDLKK